MLVCDYAAMHGGSNVLGTVNLCSKNAFEAVFLSKGFDGLYLEAPSCWPGVCTCPFYCTRMTRWCLWTLIAPLLSVIASALCAVSPHMVLHTCSPCSCWRQLVIWNSLQNWAAKSLAGVGHGYGCKERTRRNKREHLPSSLLSCQVSVPIRAHWFPASYLTVRSFLSVFDKSASHNGPCFGG